MLKKNITAVSHFILSVAVYCKETQTKVFLSTHASFFFSFATKTMQFNKKHLNLCSEDERKSYGVGTT